MKHPPFSVEFPSGIPAPGTHFGICAHQPEFEFLPLIHSDWDLLFVEEGNLVWRLKDGRFVDIPENHFLLLPPYIPLWSQPPASLLRIWCCHFSFYPLPASVFLSVQRDCMGLGRKIMIPMIFSKDEACNVWQAYRDLLSIDLDADGPMWRIASAITRLVSELAGFALSLDLPEHDQPILDPPVGPDRRLMDLCLQIRGNPAFAWKVSDLAKSVNLSVGHLDRLCQSNLGLSLKQYIIEVRFQRALALMNDSMRRQPYSIKEISSACGFSSPEFFARQFKKIFRVSPSKYRNLPECDKYMI